ncbi:hypothetical protein EDD16DRAFT_1494693, partial [Pisolithus croceorrhizus]
YFSSACIELQGVDALELMHSSMDETFVADHIANYFNHILQLPFRWGWSTHRRVLLMDLKGAGPDTVYHCVRPRFCGQDSERRRTSEGIECQGKGEP